MHSSSDGSSGARAQRHKSRKATPLPQLRAHVPPSLCHHGAAPPSDGRDRIPAGARAELFPALDLRGTCAAHGGVIPAPVSSRRRHSSVPSSNEVREALRGRGCSRLVDLPPALLRHRVDIEVPLPAGAFPARAAEELELDRPRLAVDDAGHVAPGRGGVRSEKRSNLCIQIGAGGWGVGSAPGGWKCTERRSRQRR